MRDLTPRQHECLCLIADDLALEHTPTLYELKDCLGTSYGHVQHLVSDLVRQGCVTTTRRQSLTIALTPKGRLLARPVVQHEGAPA